MRVEFTYADFSGPDALVSPMVTVTVDGEPVQGMVTAFQDNVTGEWRFTADVPSMVAYDQTVMREAVRNAIPDVEGVTMTGRMPAAPPPVRRRRVRDAPQA